MFTCAVDFQVQKMTKTSVFKRYKGTKRNDLADEGAERKVSVTITGLDPLEMSIKCTYLSSYASGILHALSPPNKSSDVNPALIFKNVVEQWKENIHCRNVAMFSASWGADMNRHDGSEGQFKVIGEIGQFEDCIREIYDDNENFRNDERKEFYVTFNDGEDRNFSEDQFVPLLTSILLEYEYVEIRRPWEEENGCTYLLESTPKASGLKYYFNYGEHHVTWLK